LDEIQTSRVESFKKELTNVMTTVEILEKNTNGKLNLPTFVINVTVKNKLTEFQFLFQHQALLLASVECLNLVTIYNKSVTGKADCSQLWATQLSTTSTVILRNQSTMQVWTKPE
jgi:hypothetical protein